ncbi:MAG: hypothetical protein IH991_05795 [Planctomycetes bacterium]|nr:hypothetical protein [Planctomycetota bacterium]
MGLRPLGRSSRIEPPKSRRVTVSLAATDHPFLFLIRDRMTQVIYFMGRVTQPDAIE